MTTVRPDTTQLWIDYKRTGEKKLWDELVAAYIPLVRYVASRVSVGLPSTIEVGDLVSYGTFGLLDAIEKFDLERSVKFETYAITRIKGAIIDELRSLDWVPRSVRAKARAIERATQALEAQLARSPTPAEVAVQLAIPEADLRAQLMQISLGGMVALDEPLSSDQGESATLGDTLPDYHAAAVDFWIDGIREALAKALDDLPDRERVVLSLYYYEQLTLAEIGLVLGVTESRVCQIHTKAALQLLAASKLPPERREV